jgi:two-component system response regulator (stage 0 sporulation protein F)
MQEESANLTQGAVILLVDDHTDSRIAMGQLLRLEGMKVFEASGGDEALQIFDAQDGEIDLLISDMKMPGMDGLELMDKLEQRTKALNLPRQLKSIALTGYPKEYTESDSAVYSFDEYIEKAGDFEEVLRVVRELLIS